MIELSEFVKDDYFKRSGGRGAMASPFSKEKTGGRYSD